MKNIPTFESFILESSINEAKGPDLKEAMKCAKEFERKSKFVKNMKGMNWKLATEPIIITNKDLDLKGSASGNYMITGAYKAYGPAYKIEFISVEPNPKFPRTMGVYTKEFDEKIFDKFVDAHKDQFLDPSRLDTKAIKDLSVLVNDFIVSELNAMFPPSSSAGGESFKSSVENMFKDAEVSDISGGKIRLDFYLKRAGDGKSVPKQNLFFVVDPTHQTVEFTNPDRNGNFRDSYTDIKTLSTFVKNSIRDWKEADKATYDNMQQNAFRGDR